jgi:uncharacterized protein
MNPKPPARRGRGTFPGGRHPAKEKSALLKNTGGPTLGDSFAPRGSSGDGTTLAPVTPGERIEIIDILRGFALFGILLVNMAFFSTSIFHVVVDFSLWTSPWDKAAEFFIRAFGEGKFYLLFSFLFGLGFALQLAKVESRGANVAPLYRRRLLILLLIGAAHAFLIWGGDILMMYALLGFPLLPFRRRKPKTLLVWAASLVVLPVFLTGLFVASIELGRLDPDARAEIETNFAEQGGRMKARLEESTRTYREGSYTEITRQRAYEVGFFYKWSIFFAPYVMGMFLLGLYVGRRGVLVDLAPHLPRIRRMLPWALLLGLLGNSVFTGLAEISNPAQPSPTGLAAQLGYLFGGPALSFFYAGALILWWRSGTGRRVLAPLAAVGRMALTNYLAQSVVCTLIFYSYGLGYFGGIGPAAGLLLTIGIYALQIPFSNWWLNRFRFGPAEWVWRSLTYGRAQPMRVAD